jgi:hypothetical protein
MMGSAVVVFILTGVVAGGAILATNAWQAAEKSANFWRDMLGTGALWYGRPMYYRWMGGVMLLLGTGSLGVFLASLAAAR